MDLRSQLTESISRVLPHLDEFVMDTVIDFLVAKGVKKLLDLRRITIDLLKETSLDHVDSSDLFDEWQKTYGNSNSAAGSSSSSSHQPSTSRAPLAPLQSNAQNVILNLPVFDADSPYVPAAVKKAMRDGTRPSSSAREDFVNRVVDRLREVVPNLSKNILRKVAKTIVGMYPASFKDTIVISEDGCDSLAFQMVTKYDNDRRVVPVLSDKEKAAPNIKEAVGCSNWNPAIPDEETLDCQLKVMQDLIKLNKISQKNWEWNLIKRKLTASYALQRKDINGKFAKLATDTRSKKRKRNQDLSDSEDETDDLIDLSIQEIQSKWPFLFTAKGIAIHFEMLTGKDFSKLLTDYISNSGANLIDFLAATNKELMSMKRTSNLAESQGFGFVPLSAVLLMLIKHFKEDRKHFIVFVERTTELNEIDEKAEFPESKTPLLICAGPNIFDYDKLYFACDNKVLCTASNILEGITLLFTSYFVFNYVFSSRLSCFLTFIQKAILQITPLKATKCVDNKTGSQADKKVLNFNNRFVTFDKQTEASVNLNDM